MKEKPQIQVATIGHTDHGKSTLLGRLLYDSNQTSMARKEKVENAGDCFAFYLDTLEEERKQGITIDTVCAQWESPKYFITFIDDPGHKKFIKNMLTGASHANGAILVVSAKPAEKIQEQTRRHLNLVRLLDIKELLIVVNKMDTVGYKKRVFTEIKNEISSMLEEAGYQPEKILSIPTSAKKGYNVYKNKGRLGWFEGPTFADALDQNFSSPKLPPGKPLRGLVQKVWNSGGNKYIVTNIVSGKIQTNQKVFFPLARVEAAVKGINFLGKSLEEASVGQGVGLLLDQGAEKIKRGDVICPPNNVTKPKERINGKIFVLTTEGIEKNEELVLRCGTKETEAKISKISKRINSETGNSLEKNAAKLQYTDFAIVALNLNEQIVTEGADKTPELSRFILTRQSQTVALGIFR